MKGLLQLSPRHVGIGLFMVLFAGFSTALGTAAATGSSHSTSSSSTCTIEKPCLHTGKQGDVDTGTTDGFFNGHVVDFSYTANFWCGDPPSSQAPTHCEGGDNAFFPPIAGQIDNLYVITPQGFTPPVGTLHCPTAGLCIDHPNHIDLSRLVGAPGADVALAAHSHIVSTDNKGKAEWWRIVIVGVKSVQAWDSLTQAKSVNALNACEANGGCTSETPSNVFLFFSVIGNDSGTDTPNR